MCFIHFTNLLDEDVIMKIWLLTTEYPPHFGGGIATYSDITTRIWAEHGHEVTVFVVDNTLDAMQVTEENSLRVVRFPNHSTPHLEALGYGARLSYYYAHWVQHFLELDGAPDIIESQEFSGIAAHLLQRKRTLDPLFRYLAVIITAHSPKFVLDPIERAPVYAFPDYWLGEMERFSLKAADGAICPSHYLKSSLIRELGNFEATVIPNPYVVPAVGTQEPGDRLLYVGRLQYLKGILTLLDTLSQLWRRHYPLSLDVVGGDSYFHPRGVSMRTFIEQRYQQEIQQGKLVLHGPMTPRQLAVFYDHAKAVILPSLFENFPYVAVEAMSHSRAVLASKTGGQADLIRHGISGWLFGPESLARQLGELAQIPPSHIKSIGEQARRDIEPIVDPERIYGQKLNYFERILESPKNVRHFPFVRPLFTQSVPVPNLAIKPGSPQLTVVIPYYNLGMYLMDTLDALEAVPDISLEIIVVDDGSTDGISIATLHRAQRQYSRVRVLRKANEGLAATRNDGARLASSPYLAFLDADDQVDSRYYARALEMLAHYDNVSFVGAWAQYFGETQGVWPAWNPEPPYALYHNPLNTSALVYKTEHFLRYGLNDPEMEYGMEDYESMVRLLANGCQGVVIPEPFFLYRIRDDSMSRGFNMDNLMLLYQWVMEKNPEFYARYHKDLILLFNANGPQYLMDNPTWPTAVHEMARRK